MTLKIVGIYALTALSSFAAFFVPTTENFATTTPKTLEIDITSEKTVGSVGWYEKLLNDPVLSEIARCESGLRQFNEDGTVLRGRINPKDIGILQINEFYHGEAAKALGLDIYTLEGNIEYGFHLYSTAGATPWKWSAPCHGIL